jgi:flagellar protein FliO/FliZ
MESIDPLRSLAAFLFVIGLIGIMAIVLRRYGRGRRFGSALLHAGGGEGRVQVVEVMYLDPRRKLVLVRRDDAEHLLLLAEGRELVIESGIKAPMMKPQDNPDK